MKTNHTTTAGLAILAALGLTLAGCGESGSGDDVAHGPDTHDQAEDTHTHADGSTRRRTRRRSIPTGEEDHAHDERFALESREHR